MKFGRNYQIQITTPLGFIISIGPPISVEFILTRNTLASANSCLLTIYNLGETKRRQVFKDRYTITDYWKMEIFAGYGTVLPTVFRGNILEASSSKTNTEWITTIEAFDGLFGIQNGFSAISVPANTPHTATIASILPDMQNIIVGLLGTPAQGSDQRGSAHIGNTFDTISEITEGSAFIDNETLNVLAEDEYLPIPPITLKSQDLLSTPKRRDTFIDAEFLFTPEVRIGQLAILTSKEAVFNGRYKILGFTHTVQILGSQGGLSKTLINLDAGAVALRPAL